MLFDKLFGHRQDSENHTQSYQNIMSQLHATGAERAHGGYSASSWDGLTEAEKDELEGVVWRKYAIDGEVAVFLPKLRHHDGVARLKKDLHRTTRVNTRVLLADILFRQTGDASYLDVLRRCCGDEQGMRLVAVTLQDYPINQEVESILRDIFQRSTDGPTQITALKGILHQYGLIHDPSDSDEINPILQTLRRLRAQNSAERMALLDEYLLANRVG